MTSHTVTMGQEWRWGTGVFWGHLSLAVLGGLLILLSGCASQQERIGGPVRQDSGDLVPKAEPRSRYGNPASYVVRGRTYYTKDDSRGHVERGVASWYGPGFHGRRTSSGERYDMNAMTAAHKTLPLPTYARVTNLENGRSAVVRINDRGPFHGPRVIDLSRAAAAKLGVLASGTAEVEVRALDPLDSNGASSNPFLLAANTPKPPSQVGNVAKSQPFLDGIDASGSASPVQRTSVGERGREPSQVAANTKGAAGVVPAAPAVGAPARQSAGSELFGPEPSGRQLVVVQRASSKQKAATAAPRQEARPAKGQVDVRVAAADSRASKGDAKAKVDPVDTKPERAKGAAESGTKIAKADPPVGGMYVQVGAFGDRSNAENLRKRLTKELARLQVQVRSINADSSALYKVQVGPLASRAKASDVSQQLAALGVTKSHVVVE